MAAKYARAYLQEKEIHSGMVWAGSLAGWSWAKCTTYLGVQEIYTPRLAYPRQEISPPSLMSQKYMYLLRFKATLSGYCAGLSDHILKEVLSLPFPHSWVGSANSWLFLVCHISHIFPLILAIYPGSCLYSYLLYKSMVPSASLWVKGLEEKKEKPTLGGGAGMGADLGKVMMMVPPACLLVPHLPLEK